MERILYVDCFSGASGDMLLGACLDAGLPLDALTEAVTSLGVGATLDVHRVRRCGIEATKVTVIDPAARATTGNHGADRTRATGEPAPTSGHPRHLQEILGLIDRSGLPDGVKSKTCDLFRRLAAVEGAVHGVPAEQVHFHEVGALDSVVDIAGTVFAFEWFGAGRVVASPLNTGSGVTHGAHGVMPVPAPATIRLIEGIPVYADGPSAELLTPTGALLVTGYARAYGPLPPMTVERTGYGAGDRDFPDRANLLRLVVGRVDDTRGGMPAVAQAEGHERLLVLECEVDDMNPQVFGPLMGRLIEQGARDVYYTALQMKKNRPGTLVTVLAERPGAEALLDLLFEETTTLGVRMHEVRRETLARESHRVDTPYGQVQIKVGRRRGRIVNVAPEFEDCARLSDASGAPIKEVLAAAIHAWRTRG